jgi:hypothetical protein
MSRSLRIQYADAWYHVMNRGRRGEKMKLPTAPINRDLRQAVGYQAELRHSQPAFALTSFRLRRDFDVTSRRGSTCHLVKQ